MSAAVRVDGLGKRYTLGRLLDPHRTLREALADATAAAVKRAAALVGAGRSDDGAAEFWALRDVSFEVPHGQALGLMGGNGAGKSTLLKLLSRITAPTTGRAEIRGRVGSLLEVGTGFHPDLTGRENVYLNGAVLGMRRAEVQRKFDEIVAFAEVERFIDTPVKRYSSGMYLRLAFAVAAHLEPEVLLVDEVLAVGDAAFQRKCLGKMGDVTAEGRTVLFVSHNMDAVQRLCSRAVLLDGGRIAASGRTDEVVQHYLARQLDVPEPGRWIDLGRASRRGSAHVRVTALRFGSGSERLGGHAHTGGPLEFLLALESDAPRTIPSLAVVIRDSRGHLLVNADIATQGIQVALPAGRSVVTLAVEALYLNPGEYTLDLWVGDGGAGHDFLESACRLRVIDAAPAGDGATPVVTGPVPCTVHAFVHAAAGGPIST